MNEQQNHTMDYDSICYKKTSLSQVIIRLDFLEFIEDDKLFENELVREVLSIFPKKGMQQIIRFQTVSMTADPKGTRAEQTTKDGVQQAFSNADGNRIILSNKYIVLEVNKYTKYEEVMPMLQPILVKMLSICPITSTRTGIRYINIFKDEKIKPQKNYFSPQVNALLETKQGSEKCIRSMAMNEYIVDDMRLNFRYGMYNPDYPQVMNKVWFVLDFDCFCEDAIIEANNVISHINKGHDSIQRMFELSITDQLRKVMGNG